LLAPASDGIGAEAAVDHLPAAAADHRLRAGLRHFHGIERRGLRALRAGISRTHVAITTHVRHGRGGAGGQQAEGQGNQDQA
jgi:hypothetical protein